jgi:hypothetical protein
MVTAEDLVGTYIGRGQEYIAKDGTVTRPGERPGAYPSRIVYTKEGLVIVVSTPAGRPKVNAKDANEATDAEKARMADGVVAYAGRYEMKDGKVHHNIEVSFFPNWVGRANIRTPKFEGNMLTLTAEPDDKGGRLRIYWEKIDKA